MKKKWVITGLLLLSFGLIAGCSGGSSGTSSSAFGVPSLEMKCNGVACVN